MLAVNGLDLEGAVKFRDTINLFFLPSSKGGIGPLKARKINARAVSPSDNALFRQIIGDVKHAVPVFDFSWPRDEYFGLQHIPHCPPSPLNTTEQLKRNAQSALNGKLNSLQIVPLLPTGGFERQATPRIGQQSTVRAGVAASSPRAPARPSNDNPANDDWSPLDAA